MSEYDELVKWLRDFADRHYHTERKEKAAQSANAIETLAKELYDARVVCGDTFDSARKWRASAEAAEAEVERLKGVLGEIKHLSQLRITEREHEVNRAAVSALGEAP